MNYADKPLKAFGTSTLIEHVITAANSQVERLVISVNSNSAHHYTQFSLPLITDILPDTPGPLLGIYSVMAWYAEFDPTYDYVAVFPADVPCFPSNIVTILLSSAESLPIGQTVLWCRANGQDQPLFSLWPFDALPYLSDTVVNQHAHGPKNYFSMHPNTCVAINTSKPEHFFNVNSEADLLQLNQMIA